MWEFIDTGESNRAPRLLTIFIGGARIFQRGGLTVSKWGYSPDCHVDFHAVFLILKKSWKNYDQDILKHFRHRL